MKKLKVFITVLALTGFLACENEQIQNEPTESNKETILKNALAGKSECNFEYEGEEGPDNWEELCNGNWVACGDQEQSPINIDTDSAIKDRDLDPIITDFHSSSTNILNNGHTIQFNYDVGSTTTLNGITYNLLQFHFHTKSEHTKNGKYFPMEMHMVHQDPITGNLAVLGVFFKKGFWNPTLGQFMWVLPENEDDTYNSPYTYNVEHFFNPFYSNDYMNEQALDKSILDFKDEAFVSEEDEDDLLMRNFGYYNNNVLNKYYTYSGSLTTPPCSEIVTWYVLKKPLRASKYQLKRFEKIMHENNRPIQDLNGRDVRFGKS